MTRDGCPDPSVLRQLLDRSFDAQSGDELAAHLATCAHCRKRLEDTAGQGDLTRWQALWEKLQSRDGWEVLLADLRTASERSSVPDGPRAGSGRAEGPSSRHEAGPPLPPESVQVEGFEVISVLGRGGSGVVYKARQFKLDRLVALKMLSAGAHASSAAVERLRAESTAIARLRHPQVVTIYDVGEQSGIPFLCLELVEGGSLAERLRGKPVSPVDAARLTASLARVIQDAHDHSIIHRDLKPANVLLADLPGSSLDPARIKLTDFGLAKRLDVEGAAGALVSGVVLGTPSYMAPEQAMRGSAAVGPAVDIYGLGAILYELLTGRPPFLGESPLETVLQVVHQTPVAPSQLDERVPEELESICLRCLEKDPAKRFPSARVLAEELDRFSSDDRARNPKPRSSARARYWGRFAVGIGICALALLAGLVLPRLRPQKKVQRVLELTLPASIRSFSEGEVPFSGKVEIKPPPARTGSVVSFDLSDDARHRLYLHWTQNARMWKEDRNDVKYWREIDDRNWFIVVYRIPFEFPVRAASLYASLNTPSGDAQGFLEVSTDPSRFWAEVAQGSTTCPACGQVDISEIVRGSSVVYVRARMKGRDDGDGSALAQFLRTSIVPDGHLETKTPHVFELCAFDRDVPIVTGIATFSDHESRPLWIDRDGLFSMQRPFRKPGYYWCDVTAGAAALGSKSRRFGIWINSTGWDVKIHPSKRLQPGEHYRVSGQLVAPGAGPCSGVVDYGDGSREEALTIGRDATVRLDHRYNRADTYHPRVTIQDDAGHMATTFATCYVDP
jgi:serine/threonine protein kinase